MRSLFEVIVEFFTTAFESIPTAASSAPAFAAYAVVVGCFSILTHQIFRARQFRQRYSELPDEDRLKAFDAEFGIIRPESPLTSEEWWRAKRTHYMVQSLYAVIFAGVALFVISGFSSGKPEALASALQDPAARGDVVDYLKAHGLFHYDDPDLSGTLAALLPHTSIPEAGDSVVIVSRRLQQLVDQHPVIRDLRHRAYSLAPPFQMVGIPARVGLPALRQDQPRECQAHVRPDGPFSNRRVEVVNPRNNQRIVLYGHPGLVTPGSSDIHLNSAQLAYLSLHIIGGRTLEVIAIPRTFEGKLIDPSSPTECPVLSGS